MPVNKRKFALSAIAAERLFVANILVLCLLLAANFVLVSGVLKAQRSAVVQKKIDLKVLNEENTAIKSIGGYLEANEDIITKTRRTIANVGFSSDYDSRVNLELNSENTTFQEQFIYDIQNYAQQVGISVVGYSFPSVDSDSGGATGATSAPQSGATATQGSTAPTGPKVPSGVQASNISVSFGNDGKIPYVSFMRFLSLLEQNTTRMYIASIDLTPDETGTQIVQGSMEITVFSRKSS